jgi:hypothetical protein
MPLYRVKWTIDIDADSAEAAAVEALRIHRDEESLATVFSVSTTVETTKIVDVSDVFPATSRLAKRKKKKEKFGYKIY